MENTIFETICAQLRLGELLSPPVPLSGGFLHRMYGIDTQRGKFAVKLLNPEIMARKEAPENFRTAEALELRLEQAGLPILPALTFHGRKMQQAEGRFYYLFDWFDGKALEGDEITDLHCGEIGKSLASIHRIDRRAAPCPREKLEIPWEDYCREAEQKSPEIFRELSCRLALLIRLQERGNRALPSLPGETSVCHNDLDPKNVLWQGAAHRIIDLESLSYDSPFVELYETAIAWAGCDFCRFRPKLFSAFVSAYEKAGGTLPEDWAVLHDGNMVRLDWLRYNLDRALGRLGEQEIKSGAAMVLHTLGRIAYYDSIREQVLAVTK